MNIDLIMLIIIIMSIVISSVITGYISRRVSQSTHHTLRIFIEVALVTIIANILIYMDLRFIPMEINILCVLVGSLLMMVSAIETTKQTTKHSKEHRLMKIGIMFLLLGFGLSVWLQQTAMI